MKINSPFDVFERKFPVDLATSKFYELWLAGAVLDARGGGLIYGMYPEGGIPLLKQSGNRFEFSGYAEPHSFILNADASTRNLNRLKLIAGKLTEPTMTEGEIPNIMRVLSPIAEPSPRFLWVHWSQTIIGPDQTTMHYNELDAMNEEANPYGFFDLELYFPRLEIGTEDGVV